MGKNKEKREFEQKLSFIKDNISNILANIYPIITSNADEHRSIVFDPFFYDEESNSLFNKIVCTSPEIQIEFTNDLGARFNFSGDIRFTNRVLNLGKDADEIRQKLKEYLLTEGMFEYIFERLYSKFGNNIKIKEMTFFDDEGYFSSSWRTWDSSAAKKYVKMIQQLSNDSDLLNKFNLLLAERLKKKEEQKLLSKKKK